MCEFLKHHMMLKMSGIPQYTVGVFG